MSHSKKVDQKAQEITRAMLRLKGYLDDDLKPTKLAAGLIVGTPDDLILTPKGKHLMKNMISEDQGLLEFLGKCNDLSVSTKKLTELVIKFGVWNT